MKLTTTFLALFLGIAALSNKVSCDDDYKDPDYADDDAGTEDVDDEQGPPPKIISIGQHMTPSIGDTINLPCKVQNRESAVIQWRRTTHSQGQTPLYFDATKQIKDERFHMDDQLTLHIKDIKQEDAGEYTCEILGQADVIRHTVEINSVPKILRIVPEGASKVWRKGSPLTLMCEAVGEPKPRIYWTHKKKHSHKEEPLEGETITYDQVSRKTIGEYTCTADNGRGKDQKSIFVDVHYEPEIEIMKEVVNSAEGYESELVCTVHAHPAAKVSWLKDDRTVKESHHITQTNEGNQHILRISNTKNSDFGSYKCVARNEIGSSNKTIVLSGKPSKPLFISTNVADDNKSPVLTWKVTSHSPITAFELIYKKQQDENFNTAAPVVIPEGENTYKASHALKNLEPGTYVAQIRAKNAYGWSAMSETSTFSGDVIGEGSPLQSKSLESSMAGGNSAPSNLEMRISLVFVLSLFVAHFLS